MANSDFGNGKKSENGLPGYVWKVACICMVAPVIAIVAIPLTAKVESNFSLNVLMAAATILTVVMVLVGLVLFSRLRDVKEEYDRICEIREKVENLWHELRKEVDEEVKRAKELLGAVRKEIEQAVREEYDKREKEAKERLGAAGKEIEQAVREEYDKREREANEAQRKRLEISEHFSKGLTLLEAKKYDEAIAEFDECIKLDPRFAEAYNNRGCAKDDKGDFDGAVADYNKAIEINPKYAIAFNNRGVAKKNKGDPDGAVADYNEAIRLNPKFAEAYNNRGNAKCDKGDPDGAVADYDEAIRLNPKLVEAYNNRGVAKKTKGDLDGAITDHNKAIELNPKDPVAHYNLACVYALKEDKARAIEYLNKAVDNGYRNLEELETDPDLKGIHEKPGYNKVVQRLKRLRGSK